MYAWLPSVLPFWLSLSAGGCGSYEQHAPTGEIGGRLSNVNTFAAGDWPGAQGGGFEVLRESDGSRIPCGNAMREPEHWTCDIGPLTGIFSMVDGRVSSPGVEPLRILVEVHEVGTEAAAYVSPMGHLAAQYAFFLHEKHGVALATAISEAEIRFAPFVLGASEPYASPARPSFRLNVDEERVAFVLEALTRVASTKYANLPTFHRTRVVTVRLGMVLKEEGEFRDVSIDVNAGAILVSREFLRHDLAVQILELGPELEVPVEETRVFAEYINGQSGPLFGFTRAPALPR